MKSAVKALGILLLLTVAGGFLLFREEPTAGIRNVLLDSQAAIPRIPASGPLRVSAANHRYFADGNGKTVYLTGSHNWNNLQDVEPPFVTDPEGD